MLCLSQVVEFQVIKISITLLSADINLKNVYFKQIYINIKIASVLIRIEYKIKFQVLIITSHTNNLNYITIKVNDRTVRGSKYRPTF